MASAAGAAVRSITPSPPLDVQTPPAPRLGGYQDNWQPYLSRCSARVSSKQLPKRTPSPCSSRQSPPSHRKQTTPNGQAHKEAFVSPARSPQKKSQPDSKSLKHPAGTLTAQDTANAAAALGLDSAISKSSRATASTTRFLNMLPTPAKTPQKPPNQEKQAEIHSFARNLFSFEEETMPLTRSRRQTGPPAPHGHSSTAAQRDAPIEIYTDSQDRIPVKDDCPENPFYGEFTVPEPSKRKSKRRLVRVPGEGVVTVDEATRREDGIIYVFRGKKVYRKFDGKEDDDIEQSETVATGALSELARPLARSSFKPRLLFPPKKLAGASGNSEDEEAVTDTENNHTKTSSSGPQTPRKACSAPVRTPDAPRFAPMSPPDTKRTTRSTRKLEAELTPLAGGASGRRSPFDSWPRTKEQARPATAKHTTTRPVSPISKRTRGVEKA